jgi:hypothetical protein
MVTDVVMVTYVFKDAELKKMRDDVVAKLIELEQIKGRLDQVKKEEGGKINALQVAINMLVSAVARGSEVREVQCEKQIVRDMFVFTDIQTGETIKEELIPKGYQFDFDEQGAEVDD